MTSSRRTNGVCAAISMFAAAQSAGAARTETGIWDVRPEGKALLSELARVCPLKHLGFVSHYDMEEAESSFRTSLPRPLRSRVDRAAGYDPKSGETRGCHNMTGVTCEDLHMLRGFERTKVIHRFVQRLCASYASCVGDANCSTDPDAKGSLLSNYTVASPRGYSVPSGTPPLPPRNN